MAKFNKFPADVADVVSTGLTLAPDLTLPSDLAGSDFFEVSTVDPSGALTTILSLTGKFAIYGLSLSGMPTVEVVTVKLTVDDVIIWNAVGFTPLNALLNVYGAVGAAAADRLVFAPFICNTSLLLQIQTVADTSVTLVHVTRPII